MVTDDPGFGDLEAGFFGTEGRDGAAALDPAVIDLIDGLVERAPRGREGLLPVLLGLQRAFGRVSWRAQELVADRFGLSPVQVAGMVSYYPALSSNRRGRLRVEVCTGTTCHLHGGGRILEAMTRELVAEADEPSGERGIALDRGRCSGACGLAPVVLVNGRIRGEPGPDGIGGLVGSLAEVGGDGEGTS
jgi:NADH-quinone oxidoreductase subunit E